MSSIFWLAVLCILFLGSAFLWSIFRRLHIHDLPPQRIMMAFLEDSPELPIQVQLDALAAQWVWTDRELIQRIWLVDSTENGVLETACTEYCQRNPWFQYCRLSDVVNIFGNLREPEKNRCNSSKKQV